MKTVTRGELLELLRKIQGLRTLDEKLQKITEFFGVELPYKFEKIQRDILAALDYGETEIDTLGQLYMCPLRTLYGKSPGSVTAKCECDIDEPIYHCMLDTAI